MIEMPWSLLAVALVAVGYGFLARAIPDLRRWWRLRGTKTYILFRPPAMPYVKTWRMGGEDVYVDRRGRIWEQIRGG